MQSESSNNYVCIIVDYSELIFRRARHERSIVMKNVERKQKRSVDFSLYYIDFEQCILIRYVSKSVTVSIAVWIIYLIEKKKNRR